MKIKKDKIFIMVMAIVVAGLAYQMILIALHLTIDYFNWKSWLLFVVDGFAVYASLTLINNNRKRERILKNEQEKRAKEEKEKLNN